MNWTEDKKRVKQTADKLAGAGHEFPKQGLPQADSNFHKRTDEQNQIESIIREYEFTSPKELQALLEETWKRLSEEDMLEWVTPCAVFTFKNKEEMDPVKRDLSTFIYEF